MSQVSVENGENTELYNFHIAITFECENIFVLFFLDYSLECVA